MQRAKRGDRFLVRKNMRPVGTGWDTNNADHFHHVAELARRRFTVNVLLKERMIELGLGDRRLSDFILTQELMQKAPHVLEERDRKIVGHIIDVAGIKSKTKIQKLHAIAAESIRETQSISPENTLFIRVFLAAVKNEKMLTETEFNRLQGGIADWMAAVRFTTALTELEEVPKVPPRKRF